MSNTEEQALLEEKAELERQLKEMMDLQAKWMYHQQQLQAGEYEDEDQPQGSNVEVISEHDGAPKREEKKGVPSEEEAALTDKMKQLQMISDSINELSGAIERGEHADQEDLARDLIRIVALGKQLDELSGAMGNGAEMGGNTNDATGDISSLLMAMGIGGGARPAQQQQQQRVQPPRSPAQDMRHLEQLNHYSDEERYELEQQAAIFRHLEEQQQAAQELLMEVKQLREEITQLSESADHDPNDPATRALYEQKCQDLAAKLELMERQKSNLRMMLENPAEAMKMAQQQQQQVESRKGDEVQAIMLALEQARDLGRRKSLQLKRQEQELATLQRNIEGLEGRLLSLKPDQLNSQYDIDPQNKFSSRSSVHVELGSQKTLSEAGNDDDDEEDMRNGEGVDRRRDDAGARGGEGGTVDDEDDEENEGDTIEEDDDIMPELNRSPDSRASGRHNLLGGKFRRRVQMKNVEETSIIAHAGSTVGDDNASESSCTNTKSDMYNVERSTMNTNLVKVPDSDYLDASDYKILMEDIHEFIVDCRSRDNGTNVSVNDRDFGRRMVNFVSKLLNELSHVDMANMDEQRRVLRTLRRLSMDPR